MHIKIIISEIRDITFDTNSSEFFRFTQLNKKLSIIINKKKYLVSIA